MKNETTKYVEYRLMITGDVIELYHYGKPIAKDYEYTDDELMRRREIAIQNKVERDVERVLIEDTIEELEAREASVGLSEEEQKELEEARAFLLEMERRRDDNIARTRKNLRRLINANGPNMDKFMTLTFAENLTDVPLAWRYFKQFVRKFRARFKDFEYIVVLEFQDRGAAHFHLACSGIPWMPKAKLKKDFLEVWGHGRAEIQKINYRWTNGKKQKPSKTEIVCDNIGRYLTKYMTKDTQDPRLSGKKAYNSSKGIQQPFEVTDKKIIQQLLGKLAGCESGRFDFESEWTGKSTWTQYNLLKGNLDYKELLEYIQALQDSE